jgi:L-2-hydroxycarboxylate dehydrogenase (NAD+)
MDLSSSTLAGIAFMGATAALLLVRRKPKCEQPAALRYVVSVEQHTQLIKAAFMARGYSEGEALVAAEFCTKASWNGVSSHNGLKALAVDDVFGAGNLQNGRCSVPGNTYKKLNTKFKAVERWDANRCSGFVVARDAMRQAMALADEYGVGVVSVDNAFHYLWGAGYVMEAAEKGYIAYTTCTGAIPEVVPLGGKIPTMGTNPHTWAFPTKDAVGFDFVMDWATSVVSNGKVKSLKRENKQLPPNAVLDADGNPTTDPAKFAAHCCFGGHKGYGLCLLTEVLAAFGGGHLPTVRCHPELCTGEKSGAKTSPNFFFQAMRPEAMAGQFAHGASQSQNVKAVFEDVLGKGNENAKIPGQGRYNARCESERAGGLIFSAAEVSELQQLARQYNCPLECHQFETVAWKA